jgi:diadenylate cyclase
MLQTLSYFFDELHRNFRITDAIDIAIISVMLYSGLMWFKETASRRVATGVILLVIVYFLARAFDLYLTSLLFQAGFAVLVIMLIVIFQEDLRRGFEQVATWGTLPSQLHTAAQITDIDTLVEVVYTLAASKRGALIAVKGREALDRHISSGVLLSGHLSKPLLLSIFDPHSPGHDGAVVLDNDRVAAFGVHLPLSKNRAEIAFRGTRHSAALGLSECSDALIIVVSEERGSVSTAERGALQDVPSAAVLKRRLERFFTHRFPTHSKPMWQRFLAYNMLLKIVAILLACTGWLLFAYDVGTIQQTFEVPIEYRNVPEHLSLDGTAPNKAQVTLTGSERAYRFLDPSSLKISIDLGVGFAGSQIIQITSRNLKLPSNLDVQRIQPRVLWIHLREITNTKPGDSGHT